MADAGLRAKNRSLAGRASLAGSVEWLSTSVDVGVVLGKVREMGISWMLDHAHD